MGAIGTIIASSAIILIGLAVYITICCAPSSVKPDLKPKTSANTKDALWQQLIKRKKAGENVDKEMDLHLYGQYHPEDRT